jgi:Ca2+-transporting ATPase
MLFDEGPADVDSDAVGRAARDIAGQGMRVLAMAYGVIPHLNVPLEAPADPDGLVFLGLQGMWDPPRVGVREAIRGCLDAGIRVLMITGDHAATAQAVGRHLGLVGEDALVLTGADLAQMDDDALRRAIGKTSIYARVTPEQKLRIVQALHYLGETVAVTGDGVNDAPALRAADIGIAMGKSGTDVAREAADMVLADDNFVSIYAAVEEGRVTFDNLRKVTFYLLSTAVAEVLTILVALVLLWPIPLRATQIIWLNLVTEGLQVVALAFERGEPGVLKRPPRSRREGIISGRLWERTLLAGLVMTLGTLFLFQWELERGGSLVRAQTVALTTMVVFQMFHVANARSVRRSLFRLSPVSNPLLFVATAATFLIHGLALYFPPIQFVLRVEPIGLDLWLWMVLVAATVLVAVESHKLLRRSSD